ncbi:unnamed protein product [Thelazia callipaeda]|uniref:Protein LNK1 n=1 Tax=Thelazia callipaeda TaxID=103827 RepID=A0A0N5CYN2_THECL|nr:unnamed protein product [Thelazia callipaeda]
MYHPGKVTSIADGGSDVVGVALNHSVLSDQNHSVEQVAFAMERVNLHPVVDDRLSVTHGRQRQGSHSNPYDGDYEDFDPMDPYPTSVVDNGSIVTSRLSYQKFSAVAVVEQGVQTFEWESLEKKFDVPAPMLIPTPPSKIIETAEGSTMTCLTPVELSTILPTAEPHDENYGYNVGGISSSVTHTSHRTVNTETAQESGTYKIEQLGDQCADIGANERSNSITGNSFCIDSIPSNEFSMDPVLPNVLMQQMMGSTASSQYSASPASYSAAPYSEQFTDPLMMSSCMQVSPDHVSPVTGNDILMLLLPHIISKVRNVSNQKTLTQQFDVRSIIQAANRFIYISKLVSLTNLLFPLPNYGLNIYNHSVIRLLQPEKHSLQDLGNCDLFGDLPTVNPVVLNNSNHLTSFESIQLKNMESDSSQTQKDRLAQD